MRPIVVRLWDGGEAEQEATLGGEFALDGSRDDKARPVTYHHAA